MKFTRPAHKKNRTMLRAGCIALFLVCASSFAHAALSTYTTIDSSTDTTGSNLASIGSNTVFISDTVGYVFYRDSDNTCVYRKTTDGGATWGSAFAVDAQTDCLNVSVWYDRWTSGDTTGTKIHIATIDSGNDSLWYVQLDTADDSLSTILEKTTTGALAVSDNNSTITKSTSGVLYMGSIDAAGSAVYQCSSTCTTGSNWTNVGSHPFNTDGSTNISLLPVSGGNIMAVWRDGATGVDDMYANLFTASSAQWGATTTIDANALDNTTHIQAFSATVDTNTSDIYVAYSADQGTPGTDDDVRTARYSGGSWSNTTDALTNTSKGLIDVGIAYDEAKKRVIVVYAARTTAGTATTGNIYYTASLDGMTTWGAESGTQNNFSDDLRHVSLDPVASTTRVYVMWHDASRSDQFGNTLDLHKYYVRKNAPAFGDGLSSATATSSIQTAENMADDDADGTDDVIYIGAGTYYESVTASVGGSAGNLFTFFGDTSGTTTGDVGEVILVGGTNTFTGSAKSYIQLENLAFTGASADGVLMDNNGSVDGVGWIFKNVDIYDNGSDGIESDAFDDSYVLDSRIHGNAGSGISGVSDGTADHSGGWIIKRSEFYGNGSAGVYFQSSAAISPFTITDNKFYANVSDGLAIGSLSTAASNNLIANNMFFGNGGDGLVLTATSPRNTISNNVSYDNASDGIELAWGGSATQLVSDSQISNNTLYNNGGYGLNSSTSGTDVTANRFYNNVVVGNRSNGVISDVDRLTNTYNLYASNRLGSYSTVSAGTGEVTTSPFFTASSTDSTGTYALNFDNSNDIAKIYDDNSALDILSSPVTIEAWVKPNTLAAGDGIIERWSSNATRVFSMQRGSATNGLGVLISSNGGNATCNATTTATMAAGQWNHVAFSLDGTRLNTSVNGKVESFPCTSSLYTNGNSALIMGYSTDKNSYFDGLIDEVRISKESLYSASTTSGVASSSPPLMMTVGTSTAALWHMNRGTGQVLYDASPNALDMALGDDTTVGSDDPAWVNTGVDFGAFLRTATSTSGVDSPAINGGSLNPQQNGVASSTTRIDGVLDNHGSLVDWGYHHASSSVVQNNFRFYTNTNSITPTSAAAATNTAITDVANGGATRIRMNAIFYSSSTTTLRSLHGAVFKLQWGQGSTCSTITHWVDVGGYASTTAIWRGYNNTGVSDGRTLPSSLLTSSLLETYQEGPATTTPSPLVAGRPAEWDWALENNGATGNTDYCFRMVHNNASSTPLGGYTNHPKVTTGAGGTPTLTLIHYRWRSDISGESDTSTWLGAEDATVNIEKAQPARLRVEISNEGTGDSSQTRFRLEYAINPSSCSSVTSWAPVGDAGSTTPDWSMSPSPWTNETASTTNYAGSLTDENGTFLAGSLRDTTAQANGMTMTGNPSSGHFTELEYSIISLFSLSSKNYCFRLTDMGVSTNFTYTVYPQMVLITPITRGGGAGATSSDSSPSVPPATGGTGQGGGSGSGSTPPVPPATGGTGQGGGSGESGYLPGLFRALERFFTVVGRPFSG